MDPEICKSISKLVGKLSTSGKKIVDAKGVKDLMYYAGKSEEYFKFTHERLLKQLRKKHSEIRLGTFLIINEFFKKSSFYRELLLDEFRTVLELTMGNGKDALPPPLEAAEELKQRVALAFQTWHQKYSKNHNRLSIAYNYLKNVLKVNFESPQGTADPAVMEEQNNYIMSTRIKKLEALREEIAEQERDISELVTEMTNSFNLLVSRPEEFLGESVTNDDDPCEDDDVDMREHGFNARTTITIEFDPVADTKIHINEDNETVLENLRGLYRRARNRFLPLIRRWLLAVSAIDDPDLKSELGQLQNSVNAQVARFEQLNLEESKCTEKVGAEDSTSDEEEDDDDFEEVPEKDGYEELAIAPPVIPKEKKSVPTSTTSASEQPSTSRAGASASLRMGVPENTEEFHDPTYGLKAEELNKVLPGSSKQSKSAKQSETSDRKAKLLAVAPKIPFDVDLYHWEDKNLKAPSVEIADTGLHRFWQPIDREGEEIENPEGLAAFRTRTIEFSGQFEPVKWTCRAPLPSGKLCPRQDRINCPFHGKVIPRDEQGNPTDPEDIERLKKEAEIADRDKVPEWQDPKLLKELKEKIGIDLTIRPAKKGGKSFSERYPNLTDIRKAAKETPRSRLEKKIFSKRAVKRVAESMDKISKKRGRDKFGDQFNYGDG